MKEKIVGKAEVLELMAENRLRTERFAEAPYDALRGDASNPERVRVTMPGRRQPSESVYVPREMTLDEEYGKLTSKAAFERLRCRYDFEFWAARCVKIRHKLTGAYGPFRLNGPQRRVLGLLEADRKAGKPIRLVMLKARQWGGSTLVQMYFAWIQTTRRRNWNSLICAHVKDTAASIRGMYDAMLGSYPKDLWEGDEEGGFRSWQGAANTREIKGRGCRVTLSSSFGQDSVRGLDFMMAHLSEVAFWKDSERMTPEDFVRSISGGIPPVADSMIVMESTANGVNNYFYRQWQAAEHGESGYRCVFVPWYEIEMYRSGPLDEGEGVALYNSFNSYERGLWEDGLTLEMIHWYRTKRREMTGDTAMHAEYPTDSVEAFANTGSAVFANEGIEGLRRHCSDAPAVDWHSVSEAEVRAIAASPAGDGELKVWRLPERGRQPVRERYVVAVDVGGRSRLSDYSVIAVFDRRPGSGDAGPHHQAEVVCQWRGHCDHDILAAYARRMARAYCEAHLVVESNSLETKTGCPEQYVLEDLAASYRNLYVRWRPDRSGEPAPESRVGFHTNRSTKGLIITNLIAMVREGAYLERDMEACNELASYELKNNGSFGARRGCHDDILMTRAIGLQVCRELPPPRELPRFEDLIGK